MPNVMDIEVKTKDNLGQEVLILYGRKAPEYCVYGVERRVMIGFADASQTGLADQQRKAVSGLAPLRGEIDGLIDGWREGTERSLFGLAQSSRLVSKAASYNRRVADALIVALEGDVPTAATLLTGIKQSILDERVARARFEYLIAACLTAICLMFAGWLITTTYGLVSDNSLTSRREAAGNVVLLMALLAAGALFYRRWSWFGKDKPVDDATAKRGTLLDRFWSSFWPSAFVLAAIAIPVAALMMSHVFGSLATAPLDHSFDTGVMIWRAAAAGSVGAFFSIAIGIRGRTVLPDLQRTSNLMDAALRVTIGFIGASVLMALLNLKLVTVSVGDNTLLDGSSLLGVLIVGFLAGFSERLVPDLLEKASVQPGTPPAAMPNPGRAPATADAKPDAKAEAGATGGGTPSPDGPEPDDDPPPDAHEDGCVCDHDLADDQVTPDSALPPASGGVATTDAEKPQ